MRLSRFRIKNYKSIKDSGYCWLASDITILAGKNESGKSAILEALRDCEENEFSQDGLPIDSDDLPLVELCYTINKEELDNLETKSQIPLNEEIRTYILNNGLTLFIDNDKRILEESLSSKINEINKDKPFDKTWIIQIYENIIKIPEFSDIDNPGDLDDSTNIDDIKSYLTELSNLIKDTLPTINNVTNKNSIVNINNQIKTLINSINNVKYSDIFAKVFYENAPKFIFFSDFEDILPFEVPFTELKKHNSIIDFAIISGLDLDRVISTKSSQKRINILLNHSARITDDFSGYWKQNDVEISTLPEENILRFGIVELGKTTFYKASQRSKGFQWFLSFYLRLNAKKGDSNIILIDEPGLYLHAKAQRDILNILLARSKFSQVLITTHSPYLIDPHRLDRVRLAIKDKERGSIIENKIHKNADQETLTPIITAIGLDVKSSLTNSHSYNVLLEGISDYYYIQAMKIKIPDIIPNDVFFIPHVGASKIPQIASILTGWGLSFLALLDNNKEGIRIHDELKNELLIDEKNIILISEKEDQSIEDMFLFKDFNSYVLDDDKNKDESVSNSKFCSKNKIDKALLSKNFFDKVSDDKKNSIKLNSETTEKFKQIFNKIKDWRASFN